MEAMDHCLGKWEIADYSSAVDYLRTLPFVDGKKIGITGGSYGGYVAALALAAAPDSFSCGIADFAVSDWSLYDSVYTERYMGLPAENPEGYRQASVLSHLPTYRGGLLLVHGSMDDNVHMQNTLQLLDAMLNLGKTAELMIYPGERHGVRGVKAVEYYRSALDFWKRKFFSLGRSRTGRTGRTRKEIMELTAVDRCPLCLSSQIALFIKGTVDAQKLSAADFKITDSHYGSRWTFFSCRNCGFVFANPAPAQGTISQFYAALADEEYSQEDEGRGRNFACILRRLGSYAPTGASLLDVGAASGIFLNLARDAGYRVAGIEPSASLAADAERLYGLKLFCGTVEQFPAGEKFEVITLLDVLEHVTDPGHIFGGGERACWPRAACWSSSLPTAAAWRPGSWAAAGGITASPISIFSTAVPWTGFCKRMVLSRSGANASPGIFPLYYLLTRLLPFFKAKALQTRLKKLHLKLQLLDSWEIYARKKEK